jgi:hypothetical protein
LVFFVIAQVVAGEGCLFIGFKDSFAALVIDTVGEGEVVVMLSVAWVSLTKKAEELNGNSKN